LKKFFRGPGVYIIIILVIMLMSTLFSTGNIDDKTISYTDFVELVQQQKVKQVVVVDRDLYGLYSDTKLDASAFPDKYDFYTYVPDNFAEDIKQQVAAITGKDVAAITTEDYGFQISFEKVPEQSWLVSFLPYLVMLILVGVFWFFMMQQSQGGGSKVMSFGKSKAKMTVDEKGKVSFRDVAGADEEKEELEEIVDFLRGPKKYLELGARIPKGVLLVGPPGTGKTLLAKAVAGEAGVPFFSISGSDFVEMFVGVGASRVRDLFENAKRNAPCIVFIDEIDAVGRHRGAGMGGGHDEREQTLNQLLVEMDGFSTNEGIIIIAATNRPDILDPALLRPGRFDRQVYVNYPDIKGREAILRVHSRGKPLGPDVDLKTLAKRTPWFTGADLENVMNEGAILAARYDKKVISMHELEEAITRVQVGPEKKSSVITEKDRKLTAYHEAGHAILAKLLPNCDPVHEVSIIPRGAAGGYTMMLPKEDSKYLTRSKMLDDITMSLGGRVAEQITLGDISSGAKADLQHATDLARKMVLEYGMTEEIGPVYLMGEQEIFLGKDFGHQKSYSEDVAAKVDAVIKNILTTAYRQAEQLLSENRDKLEAVCVALLEREKLTTEEFDDIMQGKALPKSEEAPEIKPSAPQEPPKSVPAEDAAKEQQAPAQEKGAPAAKDDAPIPGE
jgi:cell division protease FtsH